MERVPAHRSDFAWPVALAFALGLLGLQMLTGGNYGVFRDEFYYWDCANHLAWGYVDHPPLSIAILAGWKAVFGDSAHALRFLPALTRAMLVLLVARLSAELGGGRLAQAIAAMATVAVPGYLSITGFYSMNAFELVFWALGYWIALRLIDADRDAAHAGVRGKLWIVLGFVVGLGMMNKISMSVFALGLAAALLATDHRRLLRSRYPYLAALIAAVIFLPYIIWQFQHGWPTIEFVENAKRYKIAELTPAA